MKNIFFIFNILFTAMLFGQNNGTGTPVPAYPWQIPASQAVPHETSDPFGTSDLTGFYSAQQFQDDARQNQLRVGTAIWNGSLYDCTLGNIPFVDGYNGVYFYLDFQGNNSGATFLDFGSGKKPLMKYVNGRFTDLDPDDIRDNGVRCVILDATANYFIIDVGQKTQTFTGDDLGNGIGTNLRLQNIADGVVPTDAATLGQIIPKANLASPFFTGVPTAPTASAGTSTGQIATTGFVTTANNLKVNIADTSAFMFDRDTVKFANGIRASIPSSVGGNIVDLTTNQPSIAGNKGFTGTTSLKDVLVSPTATLGSGLTVNQIVGTTGTTAQINNTATTSLTGQTVLNVFASGALTTAGQNTQTATIANTRTNTATNNALTLSASGATNNYALLVNSGNVGIGTQTPLALLHNNGQQITGPNAALPNVNLSFAANSLNSISQTQYTGNTITADETALRLIRAGIVGSVFNSAVDFKVGRVSATSAGTRATIAINNGNTHLPDVDVATFTGEFGGAKVGIGTNSPKWMLHLLTGTSTGAPTAGNGIINSQGGSSRFIQENNVSAVGDKAIMLETNNGLTSFNSLSDNYQSFVQQNIVTMKHSNGNVGIGTGVPSVKLDVSGGLAINRTTSNTAAYTIAVDDYVVNLGLAGTQTVTLPTASTFPRRLLKITNSTTFVKTLGTSYNAIFGFTNTLIQPNSWIEIQSDGTAWNEVSSSQNAYTISWNGVANATLGGVNFATAADGFNTLTTSVVATGYYMSEVTSTAAGVSVDAWDTAVTSGVAGTSILRGRQWNGATTGALGIGNNATYCHKGQGVLIANGRTFEIQSYSWNSVLFFKCQIIK